jgi:S-adenosylmethionine/arginine decarboxylase-like enzyme
MTHSVPFGEIEHMACWTLRGHLDEAQVRELGLELSQLTGMTLHGNPVVDEFPTEDGKGGIGIQAYFAWVESWLLIGTWPEIGLVRVAMSTCAVERFTPITVTKYLEQAVGCVEKFSFTEW